MPKVTVIMPSLNVALYIRECMDSVVGQSLQEIEILCVDAGSTDGTWEILEEYAGRDSRIRLIRASKKSYGYQMNLGLREAEGEYIGIVETDDFISPVMYEELYACAVENDADFVKADFDLFTAFEDGKRAFLRYPVSMGSSAAYGRIFSSEDYRKSGESIDVFIWNGIYKRQFLLDHQITFQETPGAAFQDCGFRYLIAQYVQRGFFLDRSYYRYRKDNRNSSTYNSRCVLFNLDECTNLLETVRERGEADEGWMRFLAREMAVIAHRPYIELLTWGSPAEGTGKALERFGSILKEFTDRGILDCSSVSAEMWLEIRMLTENTGLYDGYAHMKAKIKSEAIRGFLDKAAQQRQIILFGCGYVGTCVYCLLRNNGIRNVTAFCDNDKGKWGDICVDLPVISPAEAAERFPEAYFMIANTGYADVMRRQLYDHGIAKEQTAIYDLELTPMDCMSLVMRRTG